jgi:ABC-type hemin transport system ATPase subunit
MLEAQSAKAMETAIATETSITVAIKGLKARTGGHLAVGEKKKIHYGRVTIFGYSLPLAV